MLKQLFLVQKISNQTAFGLMESKYISRIIFIPLFISNFLCLNLQNNLKLFREEDFNNERLQNCIQECK